MQNLVDISKTEYEDGTPKLIKVANFLKA